jgi:hypothetical protein
MALGIRLVTVLRILAQVTVLVPIACPVTGFRLLVIAPLLRLDVVNLLLGVAVSLMLGRNRNGY